MRCFLASTDSQNRGILLCNLICQFGCEKSQSIFNNLQIFYLQIELGKIKWYLDYTLEIKEQANSYEVHQKCCAMEGSLD